MLHGVQKVFGLGLTNAFMQHASGMVRLPAPFPVQACNRVVLDTGTMILLEFDHYVSWIDQCVRAKCQRYAAFAGTVSCTGLQACSVGHQCHDTRKITSLCLQCILLCIQGQHSALRELRCTIASGMLLVYISTSFRLFLTPQQLSAFQTKFE